MVVTQLYIFVKTHRIVHTHKKDAFINGKVHLNKQKYSFPQISRLLPCCLVWYWIIFKLYVP